MQINRLAFVPRLRSPWQVFDLSLQFYRGNFWPLWKIYLCQALPLALILFLVFDPTWASLIFWWLKPLMERPLLDSLSKRAFSQPTSTRENLGVLRRLRIIDIIGMLTWLRLSPNRAYLSSVEQLELLTGDTRQKRKTLLLARTENNQVAWILFAVHLEMILLFALFTLVFYFVPTSDPLADIFGTGTESNIIYEQIYYWMYVFSVSVIAPWFVCGGFMMYLNSRIKLEAWDIELGFKQLVHRLSQVIVTIFVASLMWVSAPTTVMAEETQSTEIEASVAAENTDSSSEDSAKAAETRASVQKIYEDNELIQRETTYVLDEDKKSDDSGPPDWLIAFLSMFSWLEIFAPAVQWLLYGLVLWLILWVVYRLYQMYQKQDNVRVTPYKAAKPKKQEVVVPDFFEDIETKHWPEDLLAAAKLEAEQGRQRQSLIYLLKHALNYVSHFAPELLSQSMTEPECQSAIKGHFPQEIWLPMQNLFSLWMAKAWAHREIEPSQLVQLIQSLEQLPELEGAYEN